MQVMQISVRNVATREAGTEGPASASSSAAAIRVLSRRVTYGQYGTS